MISHMNHTHNTKDKKTIEKTFTQTGTSLLEPLERRYVTPLVKFIPPFIGARYIVLIMILWSIGALLSGYLARFDIRWLWLNSAFILLHIITDYGNDLMIRMRKTGLTRWNYYMGQFLDYLFLFSVLIGYSFITTYSHKHLMFYTLAICGSFMVNSFLTFATTGILRTSYLKIGFTEVRLIFIIINIFLIIAGKVYFSSILPFIFIFSFIGLLYVIYKTQKNIWEIDVGKKQRMFTMTQRTKIAIGIGIFLFFFILLSIYAYFTDPFTPWTVYRSPHKTAVVNGEIVLKNTGELVAGQDLLSIGIAYFKAPFHIVAAALVPEKPVEGNTAEEIVRAIHKIKYDPEKNPFLVTGGHFNMLYVHNLGVFFHPILDPYTALDAKDWENRQRVYLQTVAYALESFSKCGKPYRTLVTTGVTSVSCVNIHHYPAEAMYGLLYGLHTLQTTEEIKAIYHRNEPPAPYKLKTVTTTKNLLATYKDELRNLLDMHIEKVYDKKTGLVKTDIAMSSAKDAPVRQSAFYDNVALWKTMDLANKLQIKQYSQKELDDLKQRILNAFWDEEEGIFYEDLSQEAKEQKLYSSDWLGALFMGFLDPYNPAELKYFTRNVDYINKEEIDEPFPIKYQQDNRDHRNVLVVQMFAPEYGGSAIWSLWGNEYIKLLALLYDVTGDETYLYQAKEHHNAYRRNIETYSGFPEVYDSTGKIMDEPLYNSVLTTSWIANYDQEKVLIERAE